MAALIANGSGYSQEKMRSATNRQPYLGQGTRPRQQAHRYNSMM